MEDAVCQDVPAGTRLIETMRWEPGRGVALARRHRDRLCLSARRLGFVFDPAAFDAALDGVVGDAPLRLRLTLDAAGALALDTAPMPGARALWRVAIAPERVRRGDPWLAVKSTQRALYDRLRASLPEEVDEALCLNDAGRLAEGAISNLAIERRDGVTLTPPISDGALPGVMRAEMLARGGWRVGRIRPDALRAARRIWICNALRGVMAAELVSWPA